MSRMDGMRALNLEMPDRVPRTEYSILSHSEVLSRVTGIRVKPQSAPELWKKAQQAFLKAWNFDFMWNVDVFNDALGSYYTDMGHAAFLADGSDFREAGKRVFKSEDEVLQFDPVEALGVREEPELIRFFNQRYRQHCAFYEDGVNMTGTYITCMSGLIDLLGWDSLLLTAGTDPEGFGRLTNRYSDWMMQYMNALAQCEAPVVMLHDDMVWTEGPFLHPDWYRRFIFPNYKRFVRPLLEAGKKVLYTSDGTYTCFVDDLVECGFHGFVMEPTTNMQYIAEKYGRTHSFVGNADTRILLLGSKEDIYNEVRRCMDIGKNCPGFIMAVGNHIPPNTPLDNVLWYNEFYEQLSKR